MEMENSALTQLMSTQNNILEEIRNLRMNDAVQNNKLTGPVPTNGSFQPFVPQRYYDDPLVPVSAGIYESPDIAVPPMQPFNVNYQADLVPQNIAVSDVSYMDQVQAVNPTSYDQVASNPAPVSFAPTDIGNNTKMLVNDIFRYDGSRMSKSAQEAFITDRAQGVQVGAVDALATAGTTAAGLSGLLASGIVPSLAVGAGVTAVAAYAGKEMVGGAKEVLNYQDILRRDGYKALNAFETTNEFGGIGFSLDDRQDLAGYMRDLAMDEYLSDDDMSTILQGSLDNKLLKSTTDVKSFKEKFTSLVTTVKEVAVMMDQSLEEVTAFLGEMERLGISSDKYSQVAAYAKTGASMLGMDANQYSQLLIQQTEQIAQGTGMDTVTIAEGIANNTYIAEGISEVSEGQDGLLKQYIKNNGGSAQVAGQLENNIRTNVQNNTSLQNMLMSFAAPAVRENEYGNLELDSSKLAEIIDSDKSLRTLMNESNSYTSSLDANELMRLSNGFGSAINNTGTQREVYALLNSMKDKLMEEYGMDEVNAIQQMGLANDSSMAQLLNQTLIAGSSEEVQLQFDAKALKEVADSVNIADSPGMSKRFNYWVKKNIGSHFGDAGIAIADGIGDVAQDFQMWEKGIEETGIVGADMYVGFDEDFSKNVFTGDESIVKRRNEIIKGFDSLKEKNEDRTYYKYEMELGKLDTTPEDVIEKNEAKLKTITGDQFNYLVDSVDNGQMNASKLRELQDELENGNLHASTKEQYQYILNKASGEYEGDDFFGNALAKTKQFGAWTGAKLHWGALRDTGDGDGSSWGEGSDFNSLEAIQNEEKFLKKESNSLYKELNKAAISSNHTPEEVQEIQSAIRSGNYDLVKELTSESAFRDVGEKYSDYITKTQKLNEAKDLYFDVQDHALAFGKASEFGLQALKSSEVFTEEEFDSYFGDLSKDIVKINKKMPKMNDQELYEATQDLSRVEDVFHTLTSDKQTELAQYLAQVNNRESLDFLYKEGTETIDSNKLYQYLMDTGQQIQSGENAVEGVLKDKDVDGTMTSHSKVMNKVMDTMVDEIEKMQVTVNELKQTSRRNYTSPST